MHRAQLQPRRSVPAHAARAEKVIASRAPVSDGAGGVRPRRLRRAGSMQRQPPPPSRPAAAAASEPAVRREPSPEVLAALRGADAVCFDVDSTFCADESIDELAAFLGCGDAVAALTAAAMGGAVRFEDALAQRLGVMRPSAADVAAFLAAHPHRLSPGIPETLAALRARAQRVFLVSGGFRAVIHPLAQRLGIPLDHVFANTLLWGADGGYAGFDASEFTSRSGGKAEAVAHIKAAWGLATVAMVGDGATDLEARRPGGADLFVGYGGVAYRPNIAAAADWYVMDLHELAAALRG